MKFGPVIFAVFVMIVGALFMPSYYALCVNRKKLMQAERGIGELFVALETYRVDYGHYPTDSATTEQLNADGTDKEASYEAEAAFLYRALSGANDKKKNYLADFSADRFRTDAKGVTTIVDPWGNAIGYSTLKATHPEGSGGHNPNYDLWSTGMDASKSDPLKWIKNW